MAVVEAAGFLGTGQGAVGGALIIVSVVPKVWAGQKPMP
jgi:hypothetical protein